MSDEPDGKTSAQAPSGGLPRQRKPDEDQIRARAHQIWIEEGKPDGRDKEHWLRARWELERAGGQE